MSERLYGPPAPFSRSRETSAAAEAFLDGVKRGAFRTDLQPIVSDGQVVAFESLLRLRYGNGDYRAPMYLFEQANDDDPTARVLLEGNFSWACQAALTLGLPVSLNLGQRQLQLDDFPEIVLSELARHPLLPPGWIIAEVSECTDFTREGVAAALECLARLGVRRAADDVGKKGAPNWPSLLELPSGYLDWIKIDGRLVRELRGTTGLERRHLLSGLKKIVGLVENRFGEIGIVAEGIGKVEDYNAVLDLMGVRVTMFQGNKLGPPQPLGFYRGRNLSDNGLSPFL